MTTQIRAAAEGDYDLLLPLFLGLREFSRERHPPQRDDFSTVLAADPLVYNQTPATATAVTAAKFESPLALKG